MLILTLCNGPTFGVMKSHSFGPDSHCPRARHGPALLRLGSSVQYICFDDLRFRQAAESLKDYWPTSQDYQQPQQSDLPDQQGQAETLEYGNQPRALRILRREGEYLDVLWHRVLIFVCRSPPRPSGVFCVLLDCSVADQ